MLTVSFCFCQRKVRMFQSLKLLTLCSSSHMSLLLSVPSCSTALPLRQSCLHLIPQRHSRTLGNFLLFFPVIIQCLTFQVNLTAPPTRFHSIWTNPLCICFQYSLLPLLYDLTFSHLLLFSLFFIPENYSFWFHPCHLSVCFNIYASCCKFSSFPSSP